MQDTLELGKASPNAKDVYVAKLEAKNEERLIEKNRRKEEAALSLDPTENANVFWQVSLERKLVLCLFNQLSCIACRNKTCSHRELSTNWISFEGMCVFHRSSTKSRPMSCRSWRKQNKAVIPAMMVACQRTRIKPRYCLQKRATAWLPCRSFPHNKKNTLSFCRVMDTSGEISDQVLSLTGKNRTSVFILT